MRSKKNNDSETNILKKIEKYKTIVIYSHENPDGDSLGSSEALKNLLKLNFPNKTIKKIGTRIPDKNQKIFQVKQIDKYNDEKDFLAIVLDTANTERIDDPLKSIKNSSELVKIDHHPNNDDYGDIKIVLDLYSSTAEILAKIFLKDLHLNFNKKIATNLFIGMVTDTGRFRFNSVSSSTFLSASLLMEKEIDLQKTFDLMLNQNIDEVKFRAYLQSKIKIIDNIGYVILPRNKEKKYGLKNSQVGGYVYSLSNISSLNYWFYASYNNKKNIWRISLRSNLKPINKIAEKFNGGGHANASGASVKKKKDIKKLIEELRKLNND